MNASKLKNHESPDNCWFLYILECSDSSLYTGITNRLAIRLQAHQSGTGARYTRGRLPVKLVYSEECIDRSDASKREWAVKKMAKKKKFELIKKNGNGQHTAILKCVWEGSKK